MVATTRASPSTVNVSPSRSWINCRIEGAIRSISSRSAVSTVWGSSRLSGAGNKVVVVPAIAGSQFSILVPGAAATSTPELNNWAAPPPATAGAGPSQTTSGNGGSARIWEASSSTSRLATAPGELSWTMAISLLVAAACPIESTRKRTVASSSTPPTSITVIWPSAWTGAAANAAPNRRSNGNGKRRTGRW